MYRIYFINHGYFSSMCFSSCQEAKQYGISKGFEFSVFLKDSIIGSWSIFSGWKEE